MSEFVVTSRDPSSTRESPARSTRLNGILARLFLCVVALLAVEAAARVAFTFHRDLTSSDGAAGARTWFVYSPVLGWERRPGYKGPVSLDAREFDASGYLTVDSKQVTDSTAKRVIFIGDSNTMGYGVPTDASFVEVVDRLLPGVDTINLGVLGYSSYQGRVTLDKYLPLLKPDLVIVSFNFNDRRYVVGPSQDGSETFDRVYRSSQSAWTAVRQLLGGVYTFRATRQIMSRAGLVANVQTVRLDTLRPRVDEEQYRRNLAGMAATARRAGIPLIFVSLRDSPAASSQLWKGINSLTKSDYDAAIGHLRFALAAGTSMFTDLARIHLAKAYHAKHDPDGAARVLEAEPLLSLHGGRPIRLDATYNDIMKRAAADSGMDLVAGADVLDDGDYIDFCHFDVDGHRKLGEVLAVRISQVLSHAKPGQ